MTRKSHPTIFKPLILDDAVFYSVTGYIVNKKVDILVYHPIVFVEKVRFSSLLKTLSSFRVNVGPKQKTYFFLFFFLSSNFDRMLTRDFV